MSAKLYLYSNMRGAWTWAKDKSSACAALGLAPDSFCVRAAHDGTDPPAGYEKTGILANCPAVPIGRNCPAVPIGRKFGCDNKGRPNFYAIGIDILAAHITFGKESES